MISSQAAEWLPNPPLAVVHRLIFIVWPSMSVGLFVFAYFVVPKMVQEEPNLGIALFIAGGPLLFMAWSLLIEARQPKRILLEPAALVWVTGLRKIRHVPKSRVLRTEPLQNRKHGFALCFYLDERGQERWVPVTVSIEEQIIRWLENKTFTGEGWVAGDTLS